MIKTQNKNIVQKTKLQTKIVLQITI